MALWLFFKDTNKLGFAHTYRSIYNGNLIAFKEIQKWCGEECMGEQKKLDYPEE